MANQQTEPNKKTLQSIFKLYQFNIIGGVKRGGKLIAVIRVITICTRLSEK
jgi:Tfp pilus assembly protein PilP